MQFYDEVMVGQVVGFLAGSIIIDLGDAMGVSIDRGNIEEPVVGMGDRVVVVLGKHGFPRILHHTKRNIAKQYRQNLRYAVVRCHTGNRLPLYTRLVPEGYEYVQSDHNDWCVIRCDEATNRVMAMMGNDWIEMMPLRDSSVHENSPSKHEV